MAGAADGQLDPLSELAIKHGADKWGLHMYTPIYHKHFSHLRDEPIRILELGIGGYAWERQGGASLRVWSEYFPNATIVGADIFSKALDVSDRVEILKGNQVDEDFLLETIATHGPFDIIIDDASHRAAETLRTFDILFEKLAPGALYVVEDLHCAFGPVYGGRADGSGSIIARLQDLIRDIHDVEIEHFHAGHAKSEYGRLVSAMHIYFNVAIIERGDNTFPSLFAFDVNHPDVVAAEDRLTAIVATSPSEGAFFNLAEIHAGAKEFEEALAICNRGLEQFPRSTMLLHAGQNYAAKAGRLDTRIGFLDRLIAEMPDDLGLRCHRIACHAERGEIREFFSAVDELPVIPSLIALDRLALGDFRPFTASLEAIRTVLRLKIGEFDTAIDHIRHAMFLEPHQDAWRHVLAAAALRAEKPTIPFLESGYANGAPAETDAP